MHLSFCQSQNLNQKNCQRRRHLGARYLTLYFQSECTLCTTQLHTVVPQFHSFTVEHRCTGAHVRSSTVVQVHTVAQILHATSFAVSQNHRERDPRHKHIVKQCKQVDCNDDDATKSYLPLKTKRHIGELWDPWSTPNQVTATHLCELDSILIGGLEAALHHGVAPWAWGQLCSTASPSSLSPAVPSLSCHVVCCPAGRRPRTCWWKLSPAFLPCHQFSPATCLPPALCHFPRSSFMWFTLNLSYVEFLLILSFFSQAFLFASQSLSCTPQTKLPDKDSLPRTDAFLFRRRILSPPVVLKLCCKWLLWFCKALFWIFLKALRGMRTKLSSSCFCLGCRNLQEQIYSTIYHETEPEDIFQNVCDDWQFNKQLKHCGRYWRFGIIVEGLSSKGLCGSPRELLGIERA